MPGKSSKIECKDALENLDEMGKLSPEDLDIELAEPQYNPLPTIGVRLVSIISDNTQHVGQAAYLRGLILSQAEN